MKKKGIEKIPWMASTKGKDMNVAAQIVEIKGEELLLVDISKEKPVVRICLTKKEYANYFPEDSPVETAKRWNGKCLNNLELNQKLKKYTAVRKDKPDGQASCHMGAYGMTEYRENYKTQIADESKKVIGEYTGNRNDPWDSAINQFQMDISWKRNEAREEKRWKRIDERMKTVPEIPKGFFNWAKSCVEGSRMTILPFRKKKTTEGICSSCGGITEYVRGKVNPKQMVTCPHCKTKAIIRRLDWKNTNPLPVIRLDEPVLLFQKTSEGYVQRHFIAYRDINVDNEKTDLVEVGRAFRIRNKTYTYFHKQGWDCSFWDDRNLYGMSNIRLLKGPVYRGNITDKMFFGTEYQYSAFSLMCREPGFEPVEWLTKYEKCPQIEMMAKIGLKKLALQIFPSELKGMGKPWSILGIEKEQFNRLREINGGRKELVWMQYEKQIKGCIEDEIIKWFSDNDISPGNIKFIADRMSGKRIFNYLKKQAVLCNRSPKETLGTWEDYLSMANRMMMNTAEELFYKPKDLLRSHSEAVKLCGGVAVAKRANEIIKKFPDVDSICKSIVDKYTFHDAEYSVVVPERIEDIILEGRSLGHCLDSSDIYFDRIQRRESYIVFLRKSSEIDRPFYTLEIEPDGTARQKRTTGDKQNKDFNEAKVFIRKWQKKIQKRLSNEDHKLAETSAFLRDKEFKELRENKTKIWHGSLAGKMLVEVLEADLMEVEKEIRMCG